MKKNFGFTDYLIQKEKKQRKFFQNYLKYAKEIKKVAQKELGKVRVIVFGSVLKKEEVPQDIDILVISPKFNDYKKRRELLCKMWRKFGDFSPFEFHLITPDDYKEWYKNFIKEKIEV